MMHDDLTDDKIGAYTRKIGTLQHFRWLRGIIVALLILNLLDAILTIFFVSSGKAKEANPFLAGLPEEQPLLFALVKMTLVSLGSYILWRQRKRPLAVLAIFIAFLAYYAVLVHHLSAMDLRLFERFGTWWSSLTL